MIFLFIGMIASGISARVALLSHRGGGLLKDEVRKSPSMMIFGMIGTVSGAAALFFSLLLFEWWWPLVAIAVGYGVVAPFVVRRNSYAFWQQAQFVTALIALGCSLAICGIYLGVI